jgi:hypothetical protein
VADAGEALLRLYAGSIEALLRLCSAGEALLRLYEGSIEVLLRLCSGSVKALLRLY